MHSENNEVGNRVVKRGQGRDDVSGGEVMVMARTVREMKKSIFFWEELGATCSAMPEHVQVPGSAKPMSTEGTPKVSSQAKHSVCL